VEEEEEDEEEEEHMNWFTIKVHIPESTAGYA
jgi:hypothetical protein